MLFKSRLAFKNLKEIHLFYVLRLAIVVIVLSKVLLPIIEKANFLYGSYNTLVKPYYEMEDYVKNNTEKNAMFSGWSWSMPWYLDLDPKVDRPNKNRAQYSFNQREKVPEYFVVSPEWPLVKTTDEWPSVSEETVGVLNRIMNVSNSLKEIVLL